METTLNVNDYKFHKPGTLIGELIYIKFKEIYDS